MKLHLITVEITVETEDEITPQMLGCDVIDLLENNGLPCTVARHIVVRKLDN